MIYPQEVLNNPAGIYCFFILQASDLKPGTRDGWVAESLWGRETRCHLGLGHDEKQTQWNMRFAEHFMEERMCSNGG